MVIFVVIGCLVLYLFMRIVGLYFGRSVGTVAGLGLVGLIGFCLAALVVIVLLPVLVPIAVFAIVCMVIYKIAHGVTHTSEKSSKEDWYCVHQDVKPIR